MTTQAQTPLWQTSHKIVLGGLVLAQLVAAYVVGAGHWLTNDGLYVLPPIGITATLPVVLFLAAYALSTRFRSFVLAQDLRTLTRLQHWRVVGFMFLALCAFDQLPAVFAWPAGIGDVAVGLTAAVVVTKMERDPHYATTGVPLVPYRRAHRLCRRDRDIGTGGRRVSRADRGRHHHRTDGCVAAEHFSELHRPRLHHPATGCTVRCARIAAKPRYRHCRRVAGRLSGTAPHRADIIVGRHRDRRPVSAGVPIKHLGDLICRQPINQSSTVIPALPLVQAFVLPVLFGLISQGLSYRRDHRAHGCPGAGKGAEQSGDNVTDPLAN